MKARRNSCNAEETIDVVNVDASAEYGSDAEQAEGGRSVRKRKATIPYDEDTDMDTDDLLEQEVVKTKKKPAPRGKAKILNEDGTVKAPRKYTRKKSSAFSDDDDSNGKCAGSGCYYEEIVANPWYVY